LRRRNSALLHYGESLSGRFCHLTADARLPPLWFEQQHRILGGGFRHAQGHNQINDIGHLHAKAKHRRLEMALRVPDVKPF
jgi:hypothetical protein